MFTKRNDHENAANIDLGITNKFYHIGEFANTESVKEDPGYVRHVIEESPLHSVYDRGRETQK